MTGRRPAERHPGACRAGFRRSRPKGSRSGSARCSARCALRSKTGSRCWPGSTTPSPISAMRRCRSTRTPSPRRSPSSNGCATTISLSSACASSATTAASRDRHAGAHRRAGLGILADPDVLVLRRGNEAVTTTPEIRAFLHGPDPLIVTKANAKSVVHRRIYLDYIGVKTYDQKGKLTGELRIVGLFTSTAYTRSVMKIPYLRSKARDGDRQIRLQPERPFRQGADQRAGILSARRAVPGRRAGAAQACRGDPRRSASGRACARWCAPTSSTASSRCSSSCRATATTAASARSIGDYPEDRSSTAGSPPTIRPSPKAAWPASTSSSAAPAARRRRSSRRSSRPASATSCGPGRMRSPRPRPSGDVDARLTGIAAHFPESYRGSFSAAEALRDAGRIAGLDAENPIAIDYYRHAGQEPTAGGAEDLPFRRAGGAVAARAGAREHGLPRHQRAHLRDRRRGRRPGLHPRHGTGERLRQTPIDLADGGKLFEDVFLSVWHGTVDNDGYNALAQTAGLWSREIAILRAYGRYLQQAGIPQSQGFIAAALNRYPEIARALFTLFVTRFDPARQADARSDGQAPQGQDQGRAGRGAEHRRRHHHPALPQPDRSLAAHQSFRARHLFGRHLAGDQARFARGRRAARAAALARDLRLRRGGRRACICASARSRAAACAGRTAPRTTAPRCSAWSRRSR